LQPISVLFSIAEDNLPAVLKKVHGGTTLSVTLYDRANVTELATGTLSTLDNQVDTTTGMVKLRAIFPNADESLFPSQFVNAHLLVDTLHDVVTIPVAAIQRGAPGTYVYAVGADSTVAVHPVKIGVTDGDKVQVISGVAAGDRVVTDGTDRLRPGVLVSAKDEAPAAGAAKPAAGGSGNAPDTSGTAADQPAHARHKQPQQNGAATP
jgi:multidrug efflux system membrane fusion protein